MEYFRLATQITPRRKTMHRLVDLRMGFLSEPPIRTLGVVRKGEFAPLEQRMADFHRRSLTDDAFRCARTGRLGQSRQSSDYHHRLRGDSQA